MKTIPNWIFKPAFDGVACAIQRVEHLARSNATYLRDFDRSVQLDPYSCGAQCAFMILRYFGKARSFENVLKKTGTTTDGTDQYQLRGLFAQRGLTARRINKPNLLKLRQAVRSGFPVLVSLDSNHWAVMYGFAPKAIYLADPNLGGGLLCRRSTREFIRHWDKWAMIVMG